LTVTGEADPDVEAEDAGIDTSSLKDALCGFFAELCFFRAEVRHGFVGLALSPFAAMAFLIFSFLALTSCSSSSSSSSSRVIGFSGE